MKFFQGAIIYFTNLMLELLLIGILGYLYYYYFLDLSGIIGVFISFIISIIFLNKSKFKLPENVGGFIKFLFNITIISIVWQWFLI